MNEIRGIFIKGLFFFLIGTTMLTLFIWALVQGSLTHPQAPSMALGYYFASVLAGAGGVVLYHQARYALHYAEISK